MVGNNKIEPRCSSTPDKKPDAWEDENPERGNWSGKLDFLLSCLGYAVGLGNVWRFPYLCFKNGGGSFLIPYFLMLAVIGVPTFLLELMIGQYSGMGPVTVYAKLSPIFKGLGFVNFISQCFVGLYYNMIIAWTIYYFFASLTTDLPWQHCNNQFNEKGCFSISEFKSCQERRMNRTVGEDTTVIYLNRTCIDDPDMLRDVRDNLIDWYGSEKEINGEEVKCIYTNTTYCNETEGAMDSIVELFDIPVKLRKSSSGEYLTKSVLQEGVSIEPHDFGTPSWRLTLCLLAAWVVIFLCLIKGIKSSGKVVYFTATFPYLILLVLLIRALTLEGAIIGITFYLVPEWSRLADIKVWEAAAVQIFFSLSIAGGGLITLSSYNRFHNNILRDTAIVCIGNCLTSFVAGFAIFSVLGFMANELGVNVEDVASGGTGLAFEAYPDLVTRLPASPLWAVLFFLMLFTLGLDSQFAIVETILTGILDFIPRLRPWKTVVIALVCATGFVLGLPLCCPGGPYLLDLLDYYAASWPYLFIGLMELIIISYIYGYSNYIDDLFEITSKNTLYILKIPMGLFYCFLSPLAIGIIFIFSWYNYSPLTKGDYVYPCWANGVGWIIAMIGILPVPVTAIYVFIKAYISTSSEETQRPLLKVMRQTTQHTEEWRQNAMRINKREGPMSEFEYREEGSRMVRYRTRPEYVTTVPSPLNGNTSPGTISTVDDLEPPV